MSEQEKRESTDKRVEQFQTELQNLRHEVAAPRRGIICSNKVPEDIVTNASKLQH